MKYTKDVVTKLLALRNLELLEWRGNINSGIVYKKLKDSSIHENSRANEMFNTISCKFPEEYNKIVYGDSSSSFYKNKVRKLNNFELLEYGGSGHSFESLKSKFICLSCNTLFEHYYDKIRQSRHGCPNCGYYEDMKFSPMDILKDCKPIVDPDVPPNTYWISRNGVVYTTIGRFKEIKQVTQDSGHKAIGIGRNIQSKNERSGWKKKKLVHCLVLETFGSPRPSPLHIVRHKNDIPDDNRLENLEWGLKVDNSKDMESNYKNRQEAIKKLHTCGASISNLSVACKLSEEIINAMINS